LQKQDLSGLPQVRAALEALPRQTDASGEQATTAHDLQGKPVLTAHATIAPLGWMVFIEQPRSEAFAPLNTMIFRTGLLLLLGLVLAVVASVILARKMVTPIRALQSGAAQIGGGALDYRIEVGTGDEVEALAEQFNHMAAQLQESYADLERKVEERTQELELANQAKSRLFAAASHDLRQPMHALGLFIAQLRDKVASPDTLEIVEHAQASIEALGNLFDAMLDISKLDAGVLKPNLEDFPISVLLQRMENDFTPVASKKGLALRIVPSRLRVRSDPVLLERILRNLIANAVRYTSRGGVLLGCRRRGPHVRIEVRDSGSGIPKEQQQEIFQEFYQLANPERDRGKGLGLGLAIVQRLAALLQYRIELISAPGKGSVFAVEVPIGEAQSSTIEPRLAEAIGDHVAGAFVAIVDDDTLVQQGMRGLLTDWGCHVVTAATSGEALAKLEEHERLPDAFICDYRLPGESGIEAIERLHAGLSDDIPAALISGETAPELLRAAKESGYPLLHKPVQPAKVRALLNQLLAGGGGAA
jgi:signal transduction histidine kinase/CheY-like chemotaxis protein